MVSILFAITVSSLMGFIVSASFSVGNKIEYVAKYPKLNAFFEGVMFVSGFSSMLLWYLSSI